MNADVPTSLRPAETLRVDAEVRMSSYDSLARLASSSRPSSPSARSHASKSAVLERVSGAREVDYKSGSTARTGIRPGDVVAFVTPEEGKPYVALAERDEARDGEVRYRFDTDPDGRGGSSALRDRVETHLEVLTHNGFFGFRSFFAAERLLQATRHGRQRLGFASANFGTWEEWILDEVEKKRLNDAAWTRCEITLRHRRLDAYKLQVTIVRIGRVVSSGGGVDVEQEDFKSVSRQGTPRGALSAVDRFHLTRDPAPQEPKARPHAMHVMGGALMREWAAALEKEVAARRVVEQELHDLHEADDQLREWALTELNRLRQFAQSEVDSLAGEVEERNKKMAELKQQRRALELRAKMLENLDEERLNSFVDKFRSAQRGDLLRRVFSHWRRASGANGLMKNKTIENAFAKYHANGQRKLILKRVLEAWRRDAAKEKRARRLLGSVLHRHCSIAFRTWANEMRSNKLRREVRERVAPSRRIGSYIDDALIAGFQRRGQLKQHHMRDAIVEYARKIPGVRVDLVAAAFELGEGTENAATHMLTDSLSDPLGAINLAREAMLRRFVGDEVARAAAQHAFDQGLAVASRMIQTRLNYVWLHADTVSEAAAVIKAYEMGEIPENASRQNRAMARGKLVVDSSKMSPRVGRVVMGAFYRGNYSRDYANARKATVPQQHQDAFEAGLEAGSCRYKRRELTSQARSPDEFDALCVAFDGGVAYGCLSVNTNSYTRVQAIIDSVENEEDQAHVSWMKETLMTSVEVASGNVVTTSIEFLLHKILHPLRADMMRAAFRAWLREHRENKEIELTVSRFSKRRDRRAVKEALFAWRNAVDIAKKRRIVVRRVALKIKNAKLSAAFQTWSENATNIAHQRAVLSKYVRRMTQRRLYVAFAAWAEVSTKRDDRLDKLAAVMNGRMRRFELAKAFGAWVDNTISAKENRGKAMRFVQKCRNDSLSRCLLTWHDQARESKTNRMKVRKVIMRSQQRALSVSFSHWCDLVRDKRRHGYIAASTLRRIQIRVLVKAFNKWYEFAQHEKRKRYVLHKVFARLQNEQLAQSFQRWREFAAESYDAKVKLRKIVSRMLRLRLSQGFNMWREKTEELKRERVIVARVVARMQHRCVTSCFYAWVESVEERKSSEKADAYRDRLVGNIRWRVNRSTLRSAFQRWWSVVEEREMHRELIRRNLRAKRTAMNFFMTWYWDAFDGDIQDTMADMFGQTRSYMNEAFEGTNGAAAALDFAKYYDDDDVYVDAFEKEPGGSPPPPAWSGEDFVTPSATPVKQTHAASLLDM